MRLRIAASKFLQLFQSGNLRLEDFRCLDPKSKHMIKRLFLLASVSAIEPRAFAEGSSAPQPKRSL
jgi:hypothetical protein